MGESLLKKLILEEYSKKKIKNNWQVLSEVSLGRVLNKYYDIGFIIISADRSCEAEKGSPCDDAGNLEQAQLNKKNEQQIRADIRAAGFAYVPTYGGYREDVVDPETGETSQVDNPEPEASFIVPAQKQSQRGSEDHEDLKRLGAQLSQKYNQDSFLYKPPNSLDKKAYYVTKDGEVDMTFDDVVPNDLSQIYFTRLRKAKTDRRFSMTENIYFVPQAPSSVSEARRRRGEIFIRVKRGKNGSR